MPKNDYLVRLDFLLAMMFLQIVLSVILIIMLVRFDGSSSKDIPEVTEKAELQAVHPQTTPTAQSSVQQVPVETHSSPNKHELRDVTPTVSAASEKTTAVALGDLRIEVKNGCGVKGLARKASIWLEKHQLNIVETGNADHSSYPTTMIIDRKNNTVAGRQIKNIVGSNASLVVNENIPNRLNIDFTIILGNDYQNYDFAQ